MQYVNLGRTGMKVSRLCLGTMNFGPLASEQDSFAMMDRAVEVGVNFFDTANRYGAQVHVGYTEEIIGKWLAKGGGRRDQIVLATKVYGPMGDGVNDRGLSAYHIRKACEDSLRRMQTDHIDLYQMHHVERSTPWAEIWQAMEQLVREGKVLYVGSSNFAGLHIALAQAAAEKRNFLGLVSEQSLYNLNARTIELEVVRNLRVGSDPLEPTGRRAAGWCAAADRRRTPLVRAYPAGHREASHTVGSLRGAVRRDWAGAGRRCVGMAAASAGRDRTDHRATHDGTVRGQSACARHCPGAGSAGAARRDLARARRRSAGAVCVVGAMSGLSFPPQRRPPAHEWARTEALIEGERE